MSAKGAAALERLKQENARKYAAERQAKEAARVPRQRSLQAQGVPVPDKLTGKPVQGRVVSSRTARTRSASSQHSYGRYNQARSPVRRIPSPVTAGKDTASGVGALEAEFLLAIAMLGLLLFSSGKDNYADSIMSFMKRGALVCLTFFLLALIASIGPNAAKLAKAFGALMIVGILLTAPVNNVITDVAGLIKNDWLGSTDKDNSKPSADSGTQQQSNDNSNPLDALKHMQLPGTDVFDFPKLIDPALGPVQDILSKIPGLDKIPGL
jgi:hypothetical protein